MKKIINGKVYDTEKATQVGTWDNKLYGDHEYVEESLYRKRTGEFFLFGCGGAASKYADTREGGGWTGGKKIIPLTWEAAREWAEEHLDADEYQEIFGEVAEDDSRVTVALSLSASTVETAKRAASQAGVSLSAYIERLICGK